MTGMAVLCWIALLVTIAVCLHIWSLPGAGFGAARRRSSSR